MTEFQASKSLVSQYHEALDRAAGDEITEVLNHFTPESYLWRGMHPFHVQQGADAVADTFWKPFRDSFSCMQRRPDVFMAGLNDVDDFKSEWVCSMGHLMGLFDKSWLGIPPTGKMAFLRYAEFNRVENGKIAETAMFFDIIHLMQQVGLNPLPLQTGAHFIQPGPRTHDGLLYGATDPEEGKKTLALINDLIFNLTTDYEAAPEDRLARSWHDDMIWFGPAGIGATYTRERYVKQHQEPFRSHLKDIHFNGHVCRMAEDHYGGFFGWANLSMKTSGNFMGLPASDHPTEMRVVDIYRRDGDKLAENWIFIDIPHFLNLQGVDVLGRLKSILRT